MTGNVWESDRGALDPDSALLDRLADGSSSTFLVSHGDLFGLNQVTLYMRGQEYSQEFKTARSTSLCGIRFTWASSAFWATPNDAGPLAFAIATTGYILIAIRFEERDLISFFGDRYRDYKRRVPMLVPFIKRQRTAREILRSRSRSG